MNCRELLSRLAEHADGLLGPDLCAELEAHVAGCARCAELRHDLEELSRLCRTLEGAAMPASTRARIESLLRG